MKLYFAFKSLLFSLVIATTSAGDLRGHDDNDSPHKPISTRVLTTAVQAINFAYSRNLISNELNPKKVTKVLKDGSDCVHGDSDSRMGCFETMLEGPVGNMGTKVITTLARNTLNARAEKVISKESSDIIVENVSTFAYEASTKQDFMVKTMEYLRNETSTGGLLPATENMENTLLAIEVFCALCPFGSRNVGGNFGSKFSKKKKSIKKGKFDKKTKVGKSL